MKHIQNWNPINRFIPATFCCLFCDLRILITPFISSSTSWICLKEGPGLSISYVVVFLLTMMLVKIWLFTSMISVLFYYHITVESLFIPHNNMVYIRKRILVFVFYVVFQITEKLIKRSSSQEFTLAVFNLHPRSKRTIRLNSKDPFDSPRIDPRYLQDLYDVKVLISGKNLLSFMTYHRVCK
jgi:hypothetical protein